MAVARMGKGKFDPCLDEPPVVHHRLSKTLSVRCVAGKELSDGRPDGNMRPAAGSKAAEFAWGDALTPRRPPYGQYRAGQNSRTRISGAMAMHDLARVDAFCSPNGFAFFPT